MIYKKIQFVHLDSEDNEIEKQTRIEPINPSDEERTEYQQLKGRKK